MTHSQATSPHTVPPIGFLQDPGNPRVWWGVPVEEPSYRLQLAWTVGAGFSVELDIRNGLYPDEARALAAGLEKIMAVVEGSVNG